MGFASILLEWFRENGRDLPWRQTRDPYAIWLSEIILQQTQVKQGWEYWERFMHHWPTVEALAKATEDEARVAGAGLLQSGAEPPLCCQTDCGTRAFP